MKRLRSHNILAGAANFTIPAGQYGGFMIRVTGTNQGGETLTIANLGLITSTWRGVSWNSVTYEDVNTLNGHQGGVAEAASGAGIAFTFSAFIMASYGPDGNIFDVTDDDDLIISLDLSGVTGTIVADGLVEIFGLIQDGAQAYVPRLFGRTMTVAASGSEPVAMPQDNIIAIFLRDKTNVARIQVEKDRSIFAQGTWDDLLSVSNFKSVVETGLAESIVINMNESGFFDEKLTDDVTITVDAGVGGATQLHVVSISVDPAPDVMARSRATLDNKQAMVRARKIQLGKTRAAKVSAALQGRA